MPGNLILPSDQTYVWNTAIDYDLLKITRVSGTGSTHSLTINGNASGRIGKLEIDHYGNGDAIRVGPNTSTGVCTVGVEDGGYVWIHSRPDSSVHQDGCQLAGGSNKLFKNLVFGTSSPNGSSNPALIQGFSGGNPLNSGFDFCVWVPENEGTGAVVGWGAGAEVNGVSNFITNCYQANTKTGENIHGNGNITGSVSDLPNSHSVIAYCIANKRVPWLATGGTVYNDSGTFTFPFSMTGTESHANSDSGSFAFQVFFSGVEEFLPPAPTTYDDAGSFDFTLDLSGTESAEYADSGDFGFGFLLDGFDSYTFDPGGGPPPTPEGGVIFRSWIDGWNTETEQAASTLVVTDTKKVIAHTASAQGEDRCYASQTDPAFLPITNYVKGKVRFIIMERYKGWPIGQPFFELPATDQFVFRLAFSPEGDGTVEAQVGRMDGVNAVTIDDLLSGPVEVGREYLVEYEVNRSTTTAQSYAVAVNGVTVASATPAATSVIDDVTAIQAGFADDANPDGTGLYVTVLIWDVVVATGDLDLPSQPDDTAAGLSVGSLTLTPEGII